MKTCIVTGGCGFIGSHLVEELLKNYKIIVIDDLSTGHIFNLNTLKKNKNLKIIKKSILDKSIKPLFKNIDTIFHLAAQSDIIPSIEKPNLYFNVNVKGTLNILNYAREFKIKRFVYAGSSSCYGIPKKYPTNEMTDIQPRYPYALTKYMGEELVSHWCNLYGINFFILRLFNVFGPRVRTTGHYGAVFGVFLSQLANNKPLTVVGSGKQKRDFTYVKDVVRAFKKTLKSKKFGVYNVGTGIPVTILHLVNLLGAKNIVRLPKRPGEPNQTFADINKIRKKLKWKPIYSFHYGIKQMKKDINLWKNAPLWTKKQILKETKNWFKFVK